MRANRADPFPPGAESITIGGAPEGYDAFLLANLILREDRPLLHIARDDRAMAGMKAAFRFFAPECPVLTFPAWDCAPYDRISPNSAILAARMASLSALACGNLPPRHALLTTVAAVTQRVPPREMVRNGAWQARRGQAISCEGLRDYLVRFGYNRNATVYAPGDYAFRGGVVDVFPPGDELPIRIDLFGDAIESLRRFDPTTQRTIAEADAISLAPMGEIMLDAPSIARFRSRYRQHFGAGRGDALYEAVSAGRKILGIEQWLPFFHHSLEGLLDYAPDALVSFEDTLESRVQTRWKLISNAHGIRSEKTEAHGRAFETPFNPCPSDLLYFEPETFMRMMAARDTRRLVEAAPSTGAEGIDGGGRAGRNFLPERQRNDGTLYENFAAHIAALRASGRSVVLASASEGARERLGHLLRDAGVTDWRHGAHFSELPPRRKSGRGALHLCVWSLEKGFEAPGFAALSEQDLLGERLVRRFTRKRKVAEAFADAGELAIGDLVVHVAHGIGRYQGMVTIEAAGAPHECIEILYQGGDKLFLPIQNIDLLSRYGEEKGIALDRLGAGAWQARKARLRKRIHDIADKLIRIAAERQLREAERFLPLDGAFEAFCARFPYEETEDQKSAIADVIADLGSGRPMDRLICGDVGFGKTEIALRAAHLVAMTGAQVALVAPTTLLARQHFASFSERFAGFPLRVRQLSRLVPRKEATQIREEIAGGQCDIAIGTHALLGDPMRFVRLGLLVIDEEQRFGVRHKERLKALKRDVHVLAMTATPIPRTLQLSLSGVRDLSVITTPPVDRIAVRTYTAPLDRAVVREVLLREHYRGGQSFFVVPRVEDISGIQQMLGECVPELRITTAHGRLRAAELDAGMSAFYERRADVLLSTNIVESGLDIPSANTIIIHRADMFGLAQLYQLRGRVGRTKIRAYAYITWNPRKPLDEAAEKRLKLLRSLDSLGAGFKLASHDLDMRGAGNIIGEAQSGHVREVGFALYREMLEEAIARLRAGEWGKESEEAMPAERDWSPQIRLGVPVLIPSGYIGDLDVRLSLYRRLAALDTREAFEAFGAELHDRFGKPPEEVETLLRIIRIKAICRRAGVARLEGGERGAVVTFHRDRFANPSALAKWLTQGRAGARLRADNRLLVRRDWRESETRLRGALTLVRDLARLAGAAPDIASLA